MSTCRPLASPLTFIHFLSRRFPAATARLAEISVEQSHAARANLLATASLAGLSPQVLPRLRSYWNGRLLRRFQDDMVSQKMEHGSAMAANQVGRFA